MVDQNIQTGIPASGPAPINRDKRAPSAVSYITGGLVYGVVYPTIRLLNRFGLAGPIIRQMDKSQSDRRFETFGDYQPDEHDVVIATYFKSGTNWSMQIAHQIAWRGKATYEHIHDVIPWPDSILPNYAVDVHDRSLLQSSPTGLRIIKSHLNWELIPYNERARYITVIRDPKDVCVSSYHFFHDLGLDYLAPSVSSWLDNFLSPDFQQGGPWGKYVAEYWAQRHKPNVLILSYKTMKKDLPGTVDQIAKFMGVELSPDEFKSICEQSTFQYMKSIDHKFSPGIIVPWRMKSTQIMRSGKHGGSSELLTVEQQKRIDAHFQAEFKK
ncbi:MAG TPA: sulfotransferase domain-containing protein, partial [Phototrophicaceae bacterium]|nr:sulfotransferase domain-containing protein [Phototrophicaceae bacterium]